ncbi:hypothetical protein [Rhodomicrobium lacus]|jgi:hypothetical protein|uniref:hypothetical protein n=1 Tax=Rhodomicrobium TaxID=1068 RepID=UPI000F8F16FC|nr:hypothetical protein [Rhodomicrobium lacus]WKW50825.1 hypothetical protein QMO75_16430 [Rhodomicrobium lacus]
MTSVLSPVLSESTPNSQAQPAESADFAFLSQQDSREYLADMLKELSLIAGHADLDRARELIEAALAEIEPQHS